jgi:hypothetical protein
MKTSQSFGVHFTIKKEKAKNGDNRSNSGVGLFFSAENITLSEDTFEKGKWLSIFNYLKPNTATFYQVMISLFLGQRYPIDHPLQGYSR